MVAPPHFVFLIAILRWITSALSTQEPLKINRAMTIQQFPGKRTWLGGLLVVKKFYNNYILKCRTNIFSFIYLLYYIETNEGNTIR